MSALVRILQPLRQAAAVFFQHELALHRDGGGMRLVLAPRAVDGSAGPAAPPGPAALAAAKELQELALIVSQLAALLNSQPTLRSTLRHLVFVERALANTGLQALQQVPLDVLQKALEQIEGLVSNWSPAGLASLRSRMAVAAIARAQADHGAEADARCTAAVLDHAADAAGLRDSAFPAAADEADGELEGAALAAAYAALGTVAPVLDAELTR